MTPKSACSFEYKHRYAGVRRLWTHAAALALVGWYLMMPPWYNDEKEPRLNAPIAAWEILGSYDSADQCMRKLVELANKAFARSTPKERSEFGVNCIATDDPRLKGK